MEWRPKITAVLRFQVGALFSTLSSRHPDGKISSRSYATNLGSDILRLAHKSSRARGDKLLVENAAGDGFAEPPPAVNGVLTINRVNRNRLFVAA